MNSPSASSCLRMSARWSGTMPIGLLWKWCGRALTASGRRCGIALRAELRLREFCLAALNVRRRARHLATRLAEKEETGLRGDPLAPLDWITVYAMAVNEENAAGGRVVTAPTNGAAGVVPAVAHYYERFISASDHEGIVNFFLTSAAIGILYKENASSAERRLAARARWVLPVPWPPPD